MSEQGVAGPTGASGKRAGSRKGAKPPRRRRPVVLGYAIAITLAVVAWGYLVWAAIDFGSRARDGDSGAWWFLGLAALGAVACLFVGLMLIARLSRTLGRTNAHRLPPRTAASARRAETEPVATGDTTPKTGRRRGRRSPRGRAAPS